MLGRDTQWRQGDLLSDDNALMLELVEEPGGGRRAIVISHDCDLLSDRQGFVELIVGREIERPDRMCARAHHPRVLHVELASDSGEAICLELCCGERHEVCKEQFAKLERDEQGFSILDAEKPALKQWLAARYARPAFPSTFEYRLSKKIGRRKVTKEIQRALEGVSRHLVGLFFDLGEDRFVELEDNEPYVLSISVVYDSIEGGSDAREAAETVAKNLYDLFERAYGPPEDATEIELESCTAVADTEMTLADLRRVDQWRLEFVSLREDPPGDFLAAGEAPA